MEFTAYPLTSTAEPFSIKSAEDAVTRMWESLSRNKRLEFLGEYNEICYVLGKIPCLDRTKAFKG